MSKFKYHSDADLLKAIAHNDEKAFEELFDRYWEKAHVLVFSKLKSKEITQEIVHDVFLNFWQRRHHLSIENFSHYMYVAVKYRSITYISKQASQQKYLEYFKRTLHSYGEETLQKVEYNELVNVIEEGVQALPEKTQKIFRLNRLEGKSISEIANLLNLSEKAIQYHITRSVKELKVYLKDFLLFMIISAFLLLP